MSLEDIWEDKVNDESVVDAEDINNIAHAVIDLEHGESPTVDQHYDPDSENAQSGTAVAEALDTKPGIKTTNGEVFNSPNNIASGAFSHAEGSGTQATHASAHAEGSSTIASGIAAHAEGGFTSALGYYSHAGGSYTIAKGSNQTAIGRLNAETTTAYFVVGNGTDANNRKNAFVVNSDGTATLQAQGQTDDAVVRKKYVDDALGDIESALDAIIEIQEALIGGDEE